MDAVHAYKVKQEQIDARIDNQIMIAQILGCGPLKVRCRSCGKDFIWSTKQQLYQRAMGYYTEPKRCRDCKNP